MCLKLICFTPSTLPAGEEEHADSTTERLTSIRLCASQRNRAAPGPGGQGSKGLFQRGHYWGMSCSLKDRHYLRWTKSCEKFKTSVSINVISVFSDTLRPSNQPTVYYSYGKTTYSSSAGGDGFTQHLTFLFKTRGCYKMTFVVVFMIAWKSSLFRPFCVFGEKTATVNEKQEVICF